MRQRQQGGVSRARVRATDQRSPIVVCTVITKSYLAFARAMTESLREHHPDANVFVFLADRANGEFDESREPFRIVPLDELGRQPTVERMCFYYNPFELCCALRGEAHEYMFARTRASRWLFVDADMEILGPLNGVWRQLASVDILLAPHLRAPTADSSRQIEKGLLWSGTFNGGLLGIRRTYQARRFVAWIRNRLETGSFESGVRGSFVDQAWLDLVPSCFRGVGFVSDPGVNVGFWNIDERRLSSGPGRRLRFGRERLRAFHFSGWKYATPQRLSVHREDLGNTEPSAWARLWRGYRDRLFRNGYEETRGCSYAFAQFPSGRRVRSLMRRAYFRAWSEGRAPADPWTAEAAMWRLWARAIPVEIARKAATACERILLR